MLEKIKNYVNNNSERVIFIINVVGFILQVLIILLILKLLGQLTVRGIEYIVRNLDNPQVAYGAEKPTSYIGGYKIDEALGVEVYIDNAVSGVQYLPTRTTPQDPAKYSEQDREALTQILTGEGMGSPYEVQLAIGSVALNRVADPDFPNTLYEVAHQKGQYCCFSDGNAYREPTEQILRVVDYLLENGSQLPEGVVYQASRKLGSRVYIILNGMYFCYK